MDTPRDIVSPNHASIACVCWVKRCSIAVLYSVFHSCVKSRFLCWVLLLYLKMCFITRDRSVRGVIKYLKNVSKKRFLRLTPAKVGSDRIFKILVTSKKPPLPAGITAVLFALRYCNIDSYRCLLLQYYISVMLVKSRRRCWVLLLYIKMCFLNANRTSHRKAKITQAAAINIL